MPTKQKGDPIITFQIQLEMYNDLYELAQTEHVFMINTYARKVICDFITEQRKKQKVKTIKGGEPIERI